MSTLTLVCALPIGMVAGMRAMSAPAATSWAARLGVLKLGGTPLAFLGSSWAPFLCTALAVVELVTDQLPSTPSRTVPVQLGARILMGGASGAAFGFAGGNWIVGLGLGIAGAALGTYGGKAMRSKLAIKYGSDRPAALIEDALAIGLATATVLLAA